MSGLKVAPQIIPFTFGDEPVNAGEMTSAQCTVNKGDPPLQIDWYSKGVKINGNSNGITVTKINNRMSALSIESIKAEHGGPITCTVTNKAGTTNYSSILTVNGTLYTRL